MYSLHFDLTCSLCFIFKLVADVIDLTKENEDLEMAIALSLREAQVLSFHASVWF